MDKHTNIPAVYLIFRRGDEVLLSKRKNTGFFDGHYGLVAGHVDPMESFSDAAIRECKEEAGIEIQRHHLTHVHTMHRCVEDERMEVFFEVQEWSCEPENIEPHKCEELRWFPINELPENTIPYIRRMFEQVQNKQPYSEYGWEHRSA